MGLDNIPNTYPCIEKAERNSDNQIDCNLTKIAGNCTWQNKKQENPLVKDINGTLGMFGTDCWYRGKYGNYMLSLIEDEYSNTSFYGNGFENGDEGISPIDCYKLSKHMKDNTEKYAYALTMQKEPSYNQEEVKERINDWIYATWWLDFVAEFADGSSIWY